MARSGVSGFTLLHGISSAADMSYQSVFKTTAKRYIPCLAEIGESSDKFFKGRVTDFLQKNLAPGRYDFYLCGRREMIRDVMFCVDEKFPESLIFTETFY